MAQAVAAWAVATVLAMAQAAVAWVMEMALAMVQAVEEWVVAADLAVVTAADTAAAEWAVEIDKATGMTKRQPHRCDQAQNTKKLP
jgi:hypothetical protein